VKLLEDTLKTSDPEGRTFSTIFDCTCAVGLGAIGDIGDAVRLEGAIGDIGATGGICDAGVVVTTAVGFSKYEINNSIPVFHPSATSSRYAISKATAVISIHATKKYMTVTKELPGAETTVFVLVGIRLFNRPEFLP